jgi:hypothetical protein
MYTDIDRDESKRAAQRVRRAFVDESSSHVRRRCGSTFVRIVRRVEMVASARATVGICIVTAVDTKHESGARTNAPHTSNMQTPPVTSLVPETAHPDGRASWLGAAFGPVTRNGYGVCYRFVRDESILAHVTSFAPVDAREYRAAIVDALRDMRKLFD